MTTAVSRLQPGLTFTLLVAVLAISAATTARAENDALVVRDGDDFTIDFASTSPCFAVPDTMRERVPCSGAVSSRANVPLPASVRMLAVGQLTLEDHGPRLSVSVVRMPNREGGSGAWSFEKLGADLQHSLRTGLPDGGSIRPVKPRIVYVNDLPVMRMNAILDGLPPEDPRTPFKEYQSLAAFFAEGTVYLLTVGGKNRDADEIENMVDQLAKTVHVSHPPREKVPNQDTVASWLGRSLPFVVAAVVGIAFFVRDLRRRAMLLEAEKSDREVAPRRKKKRKRRQPDSGSGTAS